MVFLLEQNRDVGRMAPKMKPKAAISQEGFDAAVKENMEDFDMDLVEAVQDAIKTFQIQGADLSGMCAFSKSFTSAQWVPPGSLFAAQHVQRRGILPLADPM